MYSRCMFDFHAERFGLTGAPISPFGPVSPWWPGDPLTNEEQKNTHKQVYWAVIQIHTPNPHYIMNF